MSSLRPAATSAARLLRNRTVSSRAASIAVMPSRAAHNIHVPVQKERTKEDSPLATLPRNAPDYNVPIDIATSYAALLALAPHPAMVG